MIASETIDQNLDFDVQSSFERSEVAEIEAKLRVGVKLGEFSHSLQEFRSTRAPLEFVSVFCCVIQAQKPAQPPADF